ncbi:5-formyltetrahydrofolate cyclo-ligase [Halobacillus sp. Marseille-Q1614]|uniref:5-formyltetrahydrofolate cyclo-ligase n=1 Tax=Halobacillus sp. Marseille-Q1614 TaxID=2709134 RepID=UPI001570E4EF|nr:5-formyltetrahydrofolate cyclo-ligase [Halobacillus sp. Marseille-Q1614]
MNKKALREHGKLILKSFSPEEKQNFQQKIHSRLFYSESWKKAKSVAVTVSFKHEWDTYSIIEKAWKDNKQVAVPKCDPKTKEMTFYLLHSFEQLETVYYGLKEPSPEVSTPIVKDEIGLIIVPGLLFDKEGYRIGYGGGFFDRYLIDYEGETVSLLSTRQLIDKVPVEPFDVKVNQLITEEGLLSCEREE